MQCVYNRWYCFRQREQVGIEKAGASSFCKVKKRHINIWESNSYPTLSFCIFDKRCNQTVPIKKARTIKSWVGMNLNATSLISINNVGFKFCGPDKNESCSTISISLNLDRTTASPMVDTMPSNYYYWHLLPLLLSPQCVCVCVCLCVCVCVHKCMHACLFVCVSKT